MQVLKNRNFTILFSSQIISSIGNSLFTIGLLWYVLQTTNSKSLLTLTGLAQTLPSVAGLFIGVFIDRWKKRHTMIVSDSLRSLILLALFFITFHSKPSILVIISLVLVLQLIGLFFSTSVMALLPQILTNTELPSAAGLNQSGTAIAQLGGMVSGGALMATLGAPLLFLSDGISFIVSVFSLLFIRVQEVTAPRKRDSSILREWLSGIKLVYQSRIIMRVVLAACVANFAMAPFDVALTVWVKGPLHGSAFTLALISGALLCGIVCGGAILGWLAKRLAMKTLLFSGFILFGLCIAMIGLLNNVVWDMFFIFISGISMGALNGSIGAMAMQVVPSEMRGKIFSALQALATISMPLGMGIFGSLMLHVSLPIIFVLIGSCGVLSGLSFLIPIKSAIPPSHTVPM